ncbi:MFS transporter [Streptodolium elevatio]|uniref:MFS transporter n=1 Tax=Streptodolium elevatio TaxID=3157996 RepID=A0ABV3DWK9_9ACTN
MDTSTGSPIGPAPGGPTPDPAPGSGPGGPAADRAPAPASGLGGPRSRAALTLALLAFAQFIVAIDYNIVWIAVPDIARELGFSATSSQWIVSAYTVVFGGLLLLGGRAADRLGARRMFMIGLGLYGVSSLVGGLAEEPGVLIAARAVQGVGGALLGPAILKLLNTSFAEGRDRNRALSVWGAVASAGLATGAVLGGVLTAQLGWEAVFYVNAVLAIPAVLAAPRLLPAGETLRSPSGTSTAGRTQQRGRAREFDLPGAFLATIGVTLVVFGLVRGPEEGWGTAQGSGALVAGVLVIALFLVVESRTRDPLVPLRLFGNRSLAVSMGVGFVYFAAGGAEYYLLTTYLQNVLGFSALEAGFAFLPLGLASVVGGGNVAAPILNRLGVRAALFAGLMVLGAGMALIALGMDVGGTYGEIVPGIVVFGLGVGMGWTALFAAAASGVRAAEQGVASAVATTAQQVGAAVGLAVFVAVANRGLGAAPTDAAVVDGLRTAGWIAAATLVAGAFLAFARGPEAPSPLVDVARQEPGSADAEPAPTHAQA